jgi:hypothetical protein
VPLRPRHLGLVALPGLVLFGLLAGYPYVAASLDLDAEVVRLLTLVRAAVGALAVGTAAAAGLAVGGDGAAASSPTAVFLGFVVAAGAGAALSGLFVWLVGPSRTSVGPAWQMLVPVLTYGVGIGFAGLAGTAVADLRAGATAADGR